MIAVRPVSFWFLEACRPGVPGGGPRARSASASRASSTSRRPGPVVITPNHASFMDPILITIPIRRPLHYMALEPFFRIRGLGAL